MESPASRERDSARRRDTNTPYSGQLNQIVRDFERVIDDPP
jgi:hypothetical protein